MSFFKKLDCHIRNYEKHVAFIALPFLSIIALGVGLPLMLLADELPPPPAPTNGTIFCAALGRQATKDECAGPTSQQPDSTIIFCDVLGKQTTKGECPGTNQPPQQNNQPNQPNQPMMNQGGPQGGPNNFQQGPNQGGQQGGPNNFQQGPNQGGQNQGQQGGHDQKQQDQQLKMMKRNVQNMSRNITSFESQIKRLQKSGVTIPSDLTDALTKVKTIMSAIKTATSFDDAQTAGLNDLPDLMQTLNDGQQTLQKLAQWQQISKQMNSTITKLQSQLKRDQATADRLAKSGGLDISAQVTAFADAITTLQGVRDQANAVVSTDPDQAFSLAQDSFFGTLDQVMQSDQIISYLSHLGNFTRTFKTLTTQMDKKIAQLKKRGEDTATVEEDLTSLKDAGSAVLAAIQAKPIDEDAIMSAFDDLSRAQQQLQSDLADLTGGAPSLSSQFSIPQTNFQPFSTNSFMPQGMGQQMPQGQMQGGGPNNFQQGPNNFGPNQGGPNQGGPQGGGQPGPQSPQSSPAQPPSPPGGMGY